MERIRQSLGSKITLAALALCLVLCLVALSAGLGFYHRCIRDAMDTSGFRLSAVLETQLSADELVRYAESGETDPAAAAVQSLLWELTELYEMERVAVVRGSRIVFDSLGESETALLHEMSEDDVLFSCAAKLQSLRTGDTMTVRDPAGRKLRVTMDPVVFRDGSVAGHILTVTSLTALRAQVRTMGLWMGVLLVAVLLVVLAVYLHIVRKTVLTPIQQLTDAVQAYEGGENKASLRRLEIKGNDELRTLADAFRMMLVEIDLRGFEERELAVREERVEAELKLTAAVNAAMEPKALPRTAERLAFDVRGLTDQSGELNRDFYDYFLLEDGKLGVVLGEVPGEGVSAALFMVVAKTVIKSQLRVGMPLLEAVTEANRQLYEVGQGMVVNAMIGILDENGVFSYINAGQQLPLLMRAQDRYEWQNVPVFAALGQNENVTYQVQKLSLYQGDRLFFHTAGLGKITGRDEETFADRRLQASLNASRSKHLKLEALLTLIHDDGKAFAERPQSVGGFALLALDYLRSRKDLAHCVVDRDRNGAMELANFLKRQLRENGHGPKEVAQVAVLADEVFALCCRQRGDSLITVECAVDQKKQLVALNWKSTFGKNPLLTREGADPELAVNYIRGAAKAVTFCQGELQDVLTIVKQL